MGTPPLEHEARGAFARHARALCPRWRRWLAASVNTIGVVLQIGAPKCAICWTTYAGLLNAGWFAATQFSPLWFATSLLTILVTLYVTVRDALRTRRCAAAGCAVLAWLLLIAGWFAGASAVRIAGFALLAIVATAPRLRRAAARAVE
ncbi:hypothetical protein DIE07_00485 [Burkholderia sp. Bp9002]|nr:hypothetical protein DIE07_00485 [Burkholderia sp. Bp9002]